MKKHGRYPKLRDGPSAIGESHVRAMKGVAMPFMHKMDGDASAFKKNGFYEIYTERVADAGLLISGQVQPEEDTEAPVKFYRSPDARRFKPGVFFDKDAALPADEVDGYYVSVLSGLGYAGDGLGFIAVGIGPKLQPDGSVGVLLRLVTTPDGKKFTTWLDLIHPAMYYNVIGAVMLALPTYYRKDDGTRDWAHGLATHSMEKGLGYDPDGIPAGEWRPEFLVYEDGGWTLSEGMLGYYGHAFRHGVPTIHSVGPRTYVALTPIYRRAGDTASTVPIPFITVSKDGGKSWAAVDGDAFVELFLDLVTIDIFDYHDTMEALINTFTAAPINASSCYLWGRTSQTAWEYYAARLNLDTLRVESVWQMDLPIVTNGRTLQLISWVYSNGKYVFSCGDRYTPDEALRFRVTPDLVNWEEHITEYAPSRCGFLTPFDPKTFLMPVFVATDETEQYEIHESKDNGQTWKRRGIVTKNAAAPPARAPRNLLWLSRFESLLVVRLNGRPGLARPDMPWVGDDRYDPPEE